MISKIVQKDTVIEIHPEVKRYFLMDEDAKILQRVNDPRIFLKKDNVLEFCGVGAALDADKWEEEEKEIMSYIFNYPDKFSDIITLETQYYSSYHGRSS